jgi:hypothetical protein
MARDIRCCFLSVNFYLPKGVKSVFNGFVGAVKKMADLSNPVKLDPVPVEAPVSGSCNNSESLKPEVAVSNSRPATSKRDDSLSVGSSQIAAVPSSNSTPLTSSQPAISDNLPDNSDDEDLAISAALSKALNLVGEVRSGVTPTF